MWFTTLLPNLILNYGQLEIVIHEQFVREEMKVDVIGLTRIQRIDDESLDDYISRFRLMKARCMTMIP